MAFSISVNEEGSDIAMAVDTTVIYDAATMTDVPAPETVTLDDMTCVTSNLHLSQLSLRADPTVTLPNSSLTLSAVLAATITLGGDENMTVDLVDASTAASANSTSVHMTVDLSETTLMEVEESSSSNYSLNSFCITPTPSIRSST